MAEQLARGARFGAYDILDELGSGGMGKVYRGRDRALDRIVAIKVLGSSFAGDEAFVQRFLSEARSAARLNHPNIVHVYDLGLCNGTYYIAMEYVDGESVGARLKRLGRLTEREAIGLTRQALLALAAAHAERIVHRDVKPDNLMLTSKGVLKLVDLGLARREAEASHVTQQGYCVGTPDFIAPEQIESAQDIDGRADIYSLGASLYNLVTGRTPFGGAPSPIVVSRHLTEPVPDPRKLVPGLSIGLCRTIVKMMAKDRSRRFQDCAEVDRELAQVEGSPPPSPSPSPSPAPTSVRPSAATTMSDRPAPAWDPELLKKIERELARHIGPLAQMLVKRNAARTSRLSELATRLADNISAPPARKEFEDAVRKMGA